MHVEVLGRFIGDERIGGAEMVECFAEGCFIENKADADSMLNNDGLFDFPICFDLAAFLVFEGNEGAAVDGVAE